MRQKNRFGKIALWAIVPALAVAPVLWAARKYDIKPKINLSQTQLENKAEEGFRGDFKEEVIEKPVEEISDEKAGNCYNLANVVYAEAANQSSKGRKIIAKMILNRAKNKNYPSDIEGVVYDKNAFSAIKDKKNKNWRQAIGSFNRNEYEEMVYDKCILDSEAVLDGERLGIPREDEIVAYHDKSVSYDKLIKSKRHRGYWKTLEPVHKEGRLVFYAPKGKMK